MSFASAHLTDSGDEGFKVVLDEPYDGAIYVRSIHDPSTSGIVDPNGRFTVRFHVECAIAIQRIDGYQLQGQLNSVLIDFGSLSLSCGHKYSSSVANTWPALGSSDRDSFATTYQRFLDAHVGKAHILNGPNSFGLFAIAPDG